VNQVARIQGATIEYCYGDEITTWSQEVFEMLKSRLRTPRSCFDGTCNPADPEHWLKKFLDSDADIYLQEYTIYDNPFLPKGFVDELCKEYAGTVYFDRFILGKWARAEGLVFKFYANSEEQFLIDDDEIFELDRDGRIKTDKNSRPIPKVHFTKFVMGVDFGGNGSQTTMVLWGYIDGYKNFITLEEDGLPLTDDIDSEDICQKWLAFYKRCIAKYGPINWIFPDSASTTMINSLRSTAKKNGLPINNIAGCRKNEVSDRPRTLSRLLNSGRLKINRRCENVRRALRSLVWDPKEPDRPEDKNLGNINDWYDADCYCFLDFVEYIDLER
jgi:PBSX family phage terminase large subunit